MEAAMASQWTAWLIRALYLILPKTAEIGMAVFAYVLGNGAPEQAQAALTMGPFVSTALFGIGCLALAAFAFHRKEF
jgi:hypothetical protein